MKYLASFFTAAVLSSGAAAQVKSVEQIQTVQTEAVSVVIENVTDGLVHPWGMAFLSESRLLVTERPGRLRIVSTDGNLSSPVEGVPEVFSKGQGGLLDVQVHPDYTNNKLVYLSFSEPGAAGASTALGRGRLENNRLEDFEVIFRQEPKVSGPYHFGGRIVFSADGHLFLTLGERFKFDPAQDLSNHLGTIVRLNHDGSVPDNNPFISQEGAEDAIWSYGHRNIESAAVDPTTTKLWVAEMGPQGGDELNQPEAGRNYGWPVVSWGEHYDGKDIPDPPTHPDFADAVKHWTPVISPSGMDFHTGKAFPAWQRSMLIGGLTEQGIVRLELEGGQVTHEERLPLGARIRDVTVGPDGFVYVLTDQEDGSVWRLKPQE